MSDIAGVSVRTYGALAAVGNGVRSALAQEKVPGALVVIEGHSDPLGILQAQQKGERTEILDQMRQVAKNLSLARANAVRSSFIQYSREHGIHIDPSQFIAIGRGVEGPKFSPPRTRDEWTANRRVRFVIKQVESELTEFKPLGN